MKRLMFIIAISLFFFEAGCSFLTPSPSSLPDYDNSKGFIDDYAPGDKFETLKPMFLTRPLHEDLSLSEPGLGAPEIDKYFENPNRFNYVIKLIPAGTKLRLVAIKAGVNCHLTYVKIEDVEEWVGVTFGEYIKIGNSYHMRYNRKLFKKIDS